MTVSAWCIQCAQFLASASQFKSTPTRLFGDARCKWLKSLNSSAHTDSNCWCLFNQTAALHQFIFILSMNFNYYDYYYAGVFVFGYIWSMLWILWRRWVPCQKRSMTKYKVRGEWIWKTIFLLQWKLHNPFDSIKTRVVWIIAMIFIYDFFLLINSWTRYNKYNQESSLRNKMGFLIEDVRPS